jgi:6-phosphogluconolactonase
VKPLIKVFPTPLSLAESLAIDIVNKITEADISDHPFTLAISGGSTPRTLFSVLGERYTSSVPWKKVHLFWIDERCVPPEDPESNFRMANETLFTKIEVPVQNIHRIKGEADPVKEAERYSKEMVDFTLKRNRLPVLDIILLGIGEDGHTASIFPGNEHLFLTDKICAAAVHPSTGQKRITITGTVINNAVSVFFLVTGKNKAAIVNNILREHNDRKQFPASFVKPTDGRLYWFLDEAAGSLIGNEKQGNNEIKK